MHPHSAPLPSAAAAAPVAAAVAAAPVAVAPVAVAAPVAAAVAAVVVVAAVMPHARTPAELHPLVRLHFPLFALHRLGLRHDPSYSHVPASATPGLHANPVWRLAFVDLVHPPGHEQLAGL